MLRGRLLTESLRVGFDLRVPQLRSVRIGRRDLGNGVASVQPNIWTYVDFEGPDAAADDLAGALAEGLVEGQAWYADFEVGDDRVVVFPGRIFRYPKGDPEGRREAARFAAGQGVPSTQLWDD